MTTLMMAALHLGKPKLNQTKFSGTLNGTSELSLMLLATPVLPCIDELKHQLCLKGLLTCVATEPIMPLWKCVSHLWWKAYNSTPKSHSGSGEMAPGTGQQQKKKRCN